MIWLEYLRLIRFSHTLFAMPFAVLGGVMALGLNLRNDGNWNIRVVDVIGIFLCMFFARSAAMGFNRYADRKIDAQNPRTAGRHLPAGILMPQSVLIFVILMSIGFLLSTLLFLPNIIPLVLSLPLLLFLFGYSYAKRWTNFAHFWLGAALMCAPIGAWLVVRPVIYPLPVAPAVLGLAVLFWSTGFDLIYACQDAQIDAEQKLYSMPGNYGIKFAFFISAICHLISVVLFAIIPIIYPLFSLVFELGVCLVAIILIAEHIIATPQKNKTLDITKINIVFFQMNIIISIGLLVIGTFDILLHLR